MKKPKYKRILLKLSGELLAGKQKFGIDFKGGALSEVVFENEHF